MSENQQFCRAQINDADKRIKDLKANAVGASEKAKLEAKAQLAALRNKAKGWCWCFRLMLSSTVPSQSSRRCELRGGTNGGDFCYSRASSTSLRLHSHSYGLPSRSSASSSSWALGRYSPAG